MLKTVDRQIDKLAAENPETIVGITTFSEDLDFYGDGSQQSMDLKIANQNFNDY